MRRILILFLFIPHMIFAARHNPVPGTPHEHKAQKAEGACMASLWHYEPVEGKFIGIWPPYVYWKKEALQSLKTKYGFSGIAIRQDEIDPDSMYQWAINAGFRPEKIMVIIAEDTYLSRVLKMPAAYYYLDEPVEHDCSGHATNGSHIYLPQDLQKRFEYIHTNRPGAKFVIGGYKRCSHLQEAAKYADGLMYSSYVNWNSWWLPACHVNMGFGDDMEAPWNPGAGLQTDSWNDMHSKFGAKFSMTWMNGRGDEYDKLFPAANSLGLEGVWLYANQGLGADSAATLEQFCQAAAANGWLKRVDDSLPTPESLKVQKAQDGRSVKLTWTDMSENEKGFIIERKSSASYNQLAEAAPGCTSFIDSTVEEGNIYYYRIKAFNDYCSSDYSNEASAEVITTTGEKAAAPVDYMLFQNHPNPYNPSTKISYTLPGESRVRLLIYNSIGSIVKTLVDEVKSAGRYELNFNASDLSSGIYFYLLEANSMLGSGSYRAARKMILLK